MAIILPFTSSSPTVTVLQTVYQLGRRIHTDPNTIPQTGEFWIAAGPFDLLDRSCMAPLDRFCAM